MSEKPFVFVRLDVILNKQIAVVEQATGEPLQFITKRIDDPDAFQRYAEKVARWWDERLLNDFEKARR